MHAGGRRFDPAWLHQPLHPSPVRYHRAPSLICPRQPLLRCSGNITGGCLCSSGFPPTARMTARRRCLPLTVNVCTLFPLLSGGLRRHSGFPPAARMTARGVACAATLDSRAKLENDGAERDFVVNESGHVRTAHPSGFPTPQLSQPMSVMTGVPRMTGVGT